MDLSHLIGSNLLRAYMHGFFMDIRLYKKVKLVNYAIWFIEDEENTQTVDCATPYCLFLSKSFRALMAVRATKYAHTCDTVHQCFISGYCTSFHRQKVSQNSLTMKLTRRRRSSRNLMKREKIESNPNRNYLLLIKIWLKNSSILRR